MSMDEVSGKPSDFKMRDREFNPHKTEYLLTNLTNFKDQIKGN